MTLIIKPRAYSDIRGIGSRIAEDNPRAAAKFIVALRRRWATLERHPYAGRPRNDIQIGIRQVIIGNYISLYRATEGDIEILRVVHSRQHITTNDLAD